MDLPSRHPASVDSETAWPAVVRWGRIAYGEALARQLDLAARVGAGSSPDTLVLVEHPPTITLGRHAPDSDVLADADARTRLGIDVVRSDRGGRATFHGPGQVVIYPIVHVTRLGLGVRVWVALLEAALREVIASYGSKGTCREGAPGIWVGGAKIASLGLRVVGGVSYHGVSLNVELDVSGFDCIVPCGQAGERMTSLAAECGYAPPVEDAAERLLAAVSARLRARARAKEIAFR
jgi:lipoate-protein ligase B